MSDQKSGTYYEVLRCFSDGKRIPDDRRLTLGEAKNAARGALGGCKWTEIDRVEFKRRKVAIVRPGDASEDCICRAPDRRKIHIDCPEHGGYERAHQIAEHAGYWWVDGCSCLTCEGNRDAAEQWQHDLVRG